MTRLFYLDHLRIFAMLMGVFVHATTLAEFGWLELVATASDHFRMGTFFAVSGFFAGMLLTRRPAATFLMSRIQSLGLPLLFGLFILNPITLLLIYNWRVGTAGVDQILAMIRMSFGTPVGIDGHFVWHLHLWFLVSLLCYTCAAPFIMKVINRPGIPAWLSVAAEKVPSWFLALAVATIISLAVAAWRVVFGLMEAIWDAPWLVRVTFSYSPYYMLGLVLYGQKPLWDRLHKVDPLLIAVVVGLWLMPTLPGNIGKLEIIIRRELTVCVTLFALLALFQMWFSQKTRLSSILSGSVYTVYLLHYLMIYALALALRPALPDGSSIQFWAISILTIVLTVALHQLVLRHAPSLLLVLNGRRAKEPAATAC